MSFEKRFAWAGEISENMFSFLIQQVKISAGNARVNALDASSTSERSHTIKSRPSNEHKWKFEIV